MSNRPTVIIADSNKNFLVYMSTLFNRMNFEVVPVDTHADVYDLSRIVHPNLIILSCDDANPTSRSILEAIRTDNLLTKVPVIMVGKDESMAEQFFAAACSDFLVKPVDLSHLHTSVQKCLPNRSGMRQHIRAPFNQHVTFSFAGLDVKCFAITLSEGGIYLRTTNPLPAGSRVEVKMQLESGSELIIKGEVAYTMGLLKGQFLVPPGMAIRFVELNAAVMALLREEVCRLLIGDIVAEQEESLFKSQKG